MGETRIYDDGRHYDRMFPLPDAVRDFFIRHARAAGGPVLELACGTGPICIPLALEGFPVAGLDASQAMLEQAGAKAAAAGARVDWVEGDMRAFELGRQFRTVLLTSNALCHLLERRDFESCMKCVVRHLVRDGRFVVTVFVPDPRLLEPVQDEPEAFVSYEDPDGRGTIDVTTTYRYESDTQIKRVRTHHRLRGGEDLGTGELDLRMYFPQELDALLAYNGFEIVEKSGDFEGSAFGPDSGFQVVHCRVA